MFWALLFFACSGSCTSDNETEAATVKVIPAAELDPHRARCSAHSGAKQPDVVFVTIDTVRADRLGYAGHSSARTPNLDALAARGQAFLQATTPLPRTTPALASMLTGLWPHHHGSREVGDRMNARRTIATELEQRGWRTVALSAMQVASPEQGFDVGFDSYEVHHDERADRLTDLALARVDEVDKNCPLFLWVHYADPHFPYLPPARWEDQPEAPGCRALAKKATNPKFRRYRLFSNQRNMASSVLDECKALYDAEIAFTDHAVGKLMAGLGERGRTDPYVVFTTDHGENQGEWGLFYEHGPDVNDASLHIPMIIAGPGIPAARTDAVARLEDVTPTLLSLLQVPKTERPPADGADLSKLWRGGKGPALALAESGSALHAKLSNYLVTGRKKRRHCINAERYSLCRGKKTGLALYDRKQDPNMRKDIKQQHPEIAASLGQAWKKWPVERTRQRVARTSRFALVASPSLSGRYSYALYDHKADPGETKDISAAHPEEAARMKAALDTWSLQLAEDNTGGATPKSAELQEALRSLGYVE